MSRFDVLISDTQSPAVFRGNLKTMISGLTFTTLLPGGCADLTCRLHLPARHLPDIIGFGYDVRLMDARGVFWAGRLEDINDHIGPDGEYWTLGAKGYGVNLDDQSYGTQNVSNTQTSQIAADVIANLTQQIDATSITATSYTISAATAVNLKALKAAAAVNWAGQFGNSTNQPVIWHVYPDDDGTVRFTLKPRPTTPDLAGYRRDFMNTEMGLNGRELYNRVTVWYNNGASSSTANDTGLQGAGPAGWGFIRELVVHIPEITQAADAAQAASSILTEVKAARLSARGALTLRANAAVRDAMNAPVDLWRIRAGQLWRFRDVDPAQGNLTNLAYNNSFLIAGTSYSEDSQEFTLTPESQDMSAGALTARALALLTGRHTF